MTDTPQRPTVVDYISGQIVPAGDEEINATQTLSRLLVDMLGWPRDQIRTRPQWSVPATPSEATKRELGKRFRGFPCDIALFASDNHSTHNILIICECKKRHLTAGIEQLKILLNLESNAVVGIWYNGEQHAIVYRDGRGGYEVDRHSPLPRPNESLDYSRTRRVLTYKDLEPAPSLKLLFEDVRDFVAAQDSRVNRDEFILIDLANLLMCKLLDVCLPPLSRPPKNQNKRSSVNGFGGVLARSCSLQQAESRPGVPTHPTKPRVVLTGLRPWGCRARSAPA
ncbi:MAG: type I restriction enzyme HsdR N-terminal domain-containing protein [Chloroflexales bacterium]|nr:type I restriction enzyme HsdR N-terminal domain-containing protein [Chloroflexales bacterium]